MEGSGIKRDFRVEAEEAEADGGGEEDEDDEDGKKKKAPPPEEPPSPSPPPSPETLAMELAEMEEEVRSLTSSLISP